MGLTNKELKVGDMVSTRDGIGMLIRHDKTKTKCYLVKFGHDKVRPYSKNEVKRRSDEPEHEVFDINNITEDDLKNMLKNI